MTDHLHGACGRRAPSFLNDRLLPHPERLWRTACVASVQDRAHHRGGRSVRQEQLPRAGQGAAVAHTCACVDVWMCGIGVVGWREALRTLPLWQAFVCLWEAFTRASACSMG
eukprot:366443-Chlamydomonas_euryale.AAC.10